MAWKATTAGLCRSSFRAACALKTAGSAAGLLAASAQGLALSLQRVLPCSRRFNLSRKLLQASKVNGSWMVPGPAAYLLGQEAATRPDGAIKQQLGLEAQPIPGQTQSRLA